MDLYKTRKTNVVLISQALILASFYPFCYSCVSSCLYCIGNPGSDLKQRAFKFEKTAHRFVGSTVLGEPKLENTCHHALLDPTISLKEAMDDISNIYGEPLDFKGSKTEKANSIFSIGTDIQ